VTDPFYERVLRTLVRDRVVAPTDRVLVVCGGDADRDALLASGFTDVVVSNLDERIHDDSPFAPYAWSRQDAEQLEYGDATFDWVVVHAGLHHCASPHRGLAEMLRVGRSGAVVFEARDSATMRAATRLGFADTFEVEAVVANGGGFGGVRNGSIPNHVYRWTERDVRKTVASLLPMSDHEIRFFYGLRLPLERLAMARSRARLAVVRTVGVAAPIVERLAPRQGNEFAFAIRTNVRLKPWIRRRDDGGYELDQTWAQARYQQP
jgi:SAM-dependent methyltransferase